MLNTTIDIIGPFTVINMSGHYEFGEIMKFERTFKEILKGSSDCVALNLSDISFIDSSGIGSLIRCMNFATHENVRFICYDLNNIVVNLFNTARLDQYIEVLSKDEFNKLTASIN